MAKLPWKKNLMKIPDNIKDKVEEIDSEYVIVSEAKRIKKNDVSQGTYSHLGITLEDGKVNVPEEILPNESVGRYSKYNLKGRTIKLKDKPKIPKTYDHEVPNFGDWSKGSRIMSRTIMVFRRNYWLPKELLIKMSLLEEPSNDEIVVKFTVDTPLNKHADDFSDELLYYLNLLQENTGVSGVYPIGASLEDYQNVLYVNWELLPPGEDNSEDNAKAILGTFRNPSREVKEKVSDRLAFFNSLNPKEIIRGDGGFSRYFGAKFEDDTVILENVRYGNAFYILFNDWQNLSQLSRTDLLKMDNNDVERIPHIGNWKKRVRIKLGLDTEE